MDFDRVSLIIVLVWNQVLMLNFCMYGMYIYLMCSGFWLVLFYLIILFIVFS